MWMQVREQSERTHELVRRSNELIRISLALLDHDVPTLARPRVPICKGCEIAMTWSRSALDPAGRQIIHVFTCPRCGEFAETEARAKLRLQEYAPQEYNSQDLQIGMATDDEGVARKYRHQAEEFRTKAEIMADETARAQYQKIADSFERLGRQRREANSEEVGPLPVGCLGVGQSKRLPIPGAAVRTAPRPVLIFT